jgi:hypothetical protein
MNLYLSRLPKKEEINSQYLSQLIRDRGGKKETIYKGHTRNKNMIFNSKNVYFPQSLERKFQFNFIVKSFNSLIKNKKRNTNSVESNQKSQRLYLPIIKEYNLLKDNKNEEENKFNTPNSKNEMYINEYFKKFPFYEIHDGNEEFSKSKNLLERSNSTISQSINNNNKSCTSSKLNNDNEKDNIIFRNLSHGSIFEAYKKQYLSSVRDYKIKSKLAETVFIDKLEKLKNLKFKKSKNEELFKEYELNFNPERITNNLKKEFQFFQDDSFKKKNIDKQEIRRKKLFNNIKHKEDKKSGLYEMKHNEMKPSQRIIQNMLRREKKLELYEKSLIDMNE